MSNDNVFDFTPPKDSSIMIYTKSSAEPLIFDEKGVELGFDEGYTWVSIFTKEGLRAMIPFGEINLIRYE